MPTALFFAPKKPFALGSCCSFDPQHQTLNSELEFSSEINNYLYNIA